MLESTSWQKIKLTKPVSPRKGSQYQGSFVSSNSFQPASDFGHIVYKIYVGLSGGRLSFVMIWNLVVHWLSGTLGKMFTMAHAVYAGFFFFRSLG